MVVSTTTVEQGSLLKLKQDELDSIKAILSKKGMSWDCLDAQQLILKFPQQYVGYIGLPDRKIIIKPKHNGVTISHILRVYYFLYSAEYTDLDTPMYDIETGNDVNLIAMYIKELLSIVHRGLPVEYREVNDDLNFIRGKLNIIPTVLNVKIHKREAFNCSFDDLTRDIGINRLLLAAAKKIESYTNSSDLSYIIRQFGNVDYSKVPENISFTKNTAYCKKAVSLAYMILNDLTLSTEGDTSGGESLLINFDKVYEDFIKKVLMEYSSVGKFTFWTEEKVYAFCSDTDMYFERAYMPDLLYDFSERNGKPTARAVLDMKNKTSLPFHNPDIYQMAFYGQMLNCKKIILCYPSSQNRKSIALRFTDEKFFLQKVYAAFMNLAGNTSSEFKNNIMSFVFRIECLL